ncbi:histidine phosphotransferase ChpT [Caulobacter sp. KR2-114]|uniref:histidine phosphotransferase ChpT n=1 Tax=Caulobacter sp. KR2-114 TaxID=3400912 RepID=UPI003BFBB3E9
MTDAAHTPDDVTPVDAPAGAAGAVSAPTVSAEDLAAKLAARLCHDFMSPASGIVSGLDLLEDPSAKDMRDEAMNLIESSARKLVDLLTFSRVAFGSYASAEVFDARELEGLAKGVFAHVRPELDWQVAEPQLPKSAARALLNLLQIAAGALATGGVARATATQVDGRYTVLVEAQHARVRMHPDVAAGLAGQPLSEGLAGRWVQAYYLNALVSAAGGVVSAIPGEEKISFQAVLPA